MSLTDDEKINLGIQAGQVFRPSAPIDEKDLFAGRREQVRRVIDTIFQRGQHAIIFGERGVGKTSLANVLSDFMQGIGETIFAPHLTCDRTDDYSKLWKKIFGEIQIVKQTRGAGFLPNIESFPVSASEVLPEKITPNDVRLGLGQLGHLCTLLIIIDEFDRLKGKEIRELFADTIKTLSDHAVRVTLILVGVAESVSELIAHHQSVQRSLVQIHMPRMMGQELEEIVVKGLTKIDMTIEPMALKRMAAISRGLPHYIHLVALHSARAAADEGTKQITDTHLMEAIKRAIADAQQGIREAYYKATMSTRTDSLYPSILLGCALSKTDEFGCFAAGDLRGPLSTILGKPYVIPNYARHMKELTKDTRGPILKTTGVKHRLRFNFVDPLMQPFILMKGCAEQNMSFDIYDNLTLF